MLVRYAVRRAIHAALLLFAISILTFLLMDLAPGDFFEDALLNPRASPQTIEALRAHYGLAGRAPARYARWLSSALHGDLGLSVAYNMPAAQLLWSRCRNTLQLTSATLLLTWFIALPLGLWSASRRGRWLDRLCALAGSSLLAVPDIVLASLLLLIAARTGWLPVGGIGGPTHVILPMLALVAGAFPVVLRHVRAAVLEAAGAPFVQAARGLGIPRRRLLLRHILPVAANPLISLFGLSLAGLLSSSMVVEVMFSWPGLGPLFLDAISARDTFVILGVVMLSAALLVSANLLADLLLYAADPRIRVER